MASVVGIYEVPEASEPCHLVEMIVPADADVGDITQADPTRPEDDWQVPWDERVIEHVGDEVRVAFFFHYLDPGTPLTTPWGELELPTPSQRPESLANVQYEEP